MTSPQHWTLTGHAGTLAGRTWPAPYPRWLVLLSPGYADHVGRYAELAEVLVDSGAVVFGHDHAGHGESAGERGLITDIEAAVDDQYEVVSLARKQYPDLPIVLIGHSIGGTVATRLAQRYPTALTALVLAGPLLGTWPGVDLLDQDPLPALAVDPDLLSRDPAAVAAFRADPLVWHGPFAHGTLAALDEMLRTIDFDHPLGDDLPGLWLHGMDDEIAPEAETRTGMDRIRGLRFEEHIYPGARHDVFHETNVDQVRTDLIDFLNRTLAG
ncbi:MAG TPA: alpha/beta fold hydrolase [Pseudonocardiaceae bacterium]|nr:alpha/beta fold hydrolase [Pseudonocardiaceae bacterium]